MSKSTSAAAALRRQDDLNWLEVVAIGSQFLLVCMPVALLFYSKRIYQTPEVRLYVLCPSIYMQSISTLSLTLVLDIFLAVSVAVSVKANCPAC